MRKTSILIILFLVSLTIINSNAQVVINEIMAINTSTIIDNDKNNKNFQDWIEIHNNSDKKISIGNWFLSDNKDKPTKCKIPFYISIDAKEYKVFFSNNDENSSNLNLDFKLSSDGETVYLFNADTILIDSLSFPAQVVDISYGRTSDSLSKPMYFQEASPMKENPSSGIENLTFSEQPELSHKAGFYNAPFNLEFNIDNNEKVYYTLDGSTPTRNSYLYAEPIDIQKTTVIRARSYSENKLPSMVITQTYFINESVSLPTVSLAINPDYLWDNEYGIYVKGRHFKQHIFKSENYFQKWERPINIEYFDINNEPEFNIEAGVRIHGRSTRTFNQKTLAIFTRDKYGTPELTYKLFGDSSPDTTKTFLLRNGGNDWGSTMFLDGLIHTLVNGKIDIDAQLYQPSIVFLNGEYWGIHNIREKVNEHYIKHKCHNQYKKFDIIEADGNIGKFEACYGNMDEFEKLIKYLESNNLSAKENYDAVKKCIDIDELINYLIIQVYIFNKDWPGSNVKFWKDRNESGKWRWILYDTELSFVENNDYFKTKSMLEHMLSNNSTLRSNPPWSNYLIRKLFENEEFKNEFIQRTAVYLSTIFDPENVFHVMDSLKQNIEPEIERNLNKWGGIRQPVVPYLVTSKTKSEWEINISYLKTFAQNRPSNVRMNVLDYFELSDTVNLKVKINEESAGKIALMGYTLEKNEFDGYVFAGVPIRIEAIPNEGYEFVKWKKEDFGSKGTFIIDKDTKLTAIFRKIE